MPDLFERSSTLPARGTGGSSSRGFKSQRSERSKLAFAAPTAASTGSSNLLAEEENVPSNTLPANIAVQGLGRTQVAKPFLDGYAPAPVPRVGQKAMQRQPGPGQYDVKGAQAALAESASVQTAAFGEQMQPAVDLRSLVNKSQASVPSSHDYEPKFVSLVNQPQIGSAFQSKSIRFGMTDTQKTQQAVPVDYSGEHGYEYGSVAHNVARAARTGASSMFASTLARSSWIPESDEEKAARQKRVLREQMEAAARQEAWEAELQRQREADPEWVAAEQQRLAEEDAERRRIEKAAMDAAERVARKEREEARQLWLQARLAEEWAWKQAEEEIEAAEGPAPAATRRSQKKKKGAPGMSLWSLQEEEEGGEEGEEDEWGGGMHTGEEDEEGSHERLRERRREERAREREEDAREARIAERAAELVAEREAQKQAEAAEAAEEAATLAAERAAARLREAQEEERARARAEFEAWLAAEAARDPDAEAIRVAEAAMNAEQRARAFAEREARLEARAAEQARWEAEQARKLAEEERELRRVYEEARRAEKERLDAEEKVRRAAERERQALAVQDWSWQEAMELAWDRAEKAKEKLALRIERTTIGAVKSRQQRAEEKSLARSQMSRMNASGLNGGQSQSAAFASTTSRFGDKSVDEAMQFVNPEERAKRKTHERMLARSRKRAERLNNAACAIQKYARRRLGCCERYRRIRHRELDVAAPPLQALVRGWKVRARLRWCAAIATLLQRWVRGWLGRRLARWQVERVPTIQSCARGMLVRVEYRRVRTAVTVIASGYRGLVARNLQRALRADPERVRRWDILCRVKEEVDKAHGQLKDLAVAREGERGQLKLALAHEMDKLGDSCKNAPQVAVMMQQEKLAAKDADEIAVGISRAADLLVLLRQVPFARAADATAAVTEEVEWLLNLTEQQLRRDELYKPASHRITDLFGTSPPARQPLSRDEQLDSYRSVGFNGGHGASQLGDVGGEEEEEPTEEELAAERARRAAARRVSSAGGTAPIKLGYGVHHGAGMQQPAKKWTGKGPPPPGWNKAHSRAGPPPPGFRPGQRPMAGGASPAKPRSRSASPRPGPSASSSRGSSPAPSRRGASPAPARNAASPVGPTASSTSSLGRPSPVPSIAKDIRTLAGTDGPPMQLSGGFGTPGSRASSASPAASHPFGSSRSGSTRSTASVRSATSSVASFASFGGASSAGGSTVGSARSVGSSAGGSSTGSRGRIQPKRKSGMTQLDFEQQRLQRMARAAQAKEQETLEKAKRQAQRSKRVAGFIIDPKKLEEQKQMREREALQRIAAEKADKVAKEKQAEEARQQERAARAAKAQKAEQLALDRLRQRKAEERKKAAQAAEAEAAEAEERKRQEEEARQAKAEQRRLRAETSFFSRTYEGMQPAVSAHTSSMVNLQGPMPLS